ncbi:MAG TPA: helicase-related protein, partial [Rhodanobacteraceae bacterium]|nr:helicase-related protein [Rhodanobacteraceae bacterium]
MLNMGFAEDVDAILAATPAARQTALFSATMPSAIRAIARAHMRDPVEITIAAKTATAANIRQRYWTVSGMHKLDALTRILEAEAFDAMLIFARTRQATEILAEKLQARGFTAAAIHGDIAQPQRERLIQQLRDGKLDILVATDVAARGLDVPRISHVLNYDIPYDTEAYVHRIGRTGRAGSKGEAIVFVSPRERGMLRSIERATRQPLEAMELPSVDVVNDHRVRRFLGRIDAALAGDDLVPFRQIIERYEREHDTPAIEIAAALARLAHGDKPLLLKESAHDSIAPAKHERSTRHDPRSSRERAPHGAAGSRDAAPRKPYERKQRAERPHQGEPGKQTYRIEVGHAHGAQPKHIIGAIANEGDIDSRYIGRLTIRDDYSLIDLPEGMPNELLAHFKKVRVVGRPLHMRLEADAGSEPPVGAPAARPRKGGDHKSKSGKGGFKPPRRPKRQQK